MQPTQRNEFTGTLTATSSNTDVAPSILTFKVVDGSSNDYDANDTAYPAERANQLQSPSIKASKVYDSFNWGLILIFCKMMTRNIIPVPVFI